MYSQEVAAISISRGIRHSKNTELQRTSFYHAIPGTTNRREERRVEGACRQVGTGAAMWMGGVDGGLNCLYVTDRSNGHRKGSANMSSNTHFSIAVHILCALSYNNGKLVGSEDLAKTVGTNPSFVRGLIGQLRNAGLVETQLGKGGGTSLARGATEITLADVYRATETQPVLKAHACDGNSPCPVASNMSAMLKSVNKRIDHVLDQELKQVTVADLVADFIEKSA